jgi:hypothetical protein
VPGPEHHGIVQSDLAAGGPGSYSTILRRRDPALPTGPVTPSEARDCPGWPGGSAASSGSDIPAGPAARALPSTKSIKAPNHTECSMPHHHFWMKPLADLGLPWCFKTKVFQAK